MPSSSQSAKYVLRRHSQYCCFGFGHRLDAHAAHAFYATMHPTLQFHTQFLQAARTRTCIRYQALSIRYLNEQTADISLRRLRLLIGRRYSYRAPIGTLVALCKSDSPMLHFNVVIFASIAVRSKSYHAEYRCRLWHIMHQQLHGVMCLNKV